MFRILSQKLFSHSISEGISPLSSSFQQLLRGPITCGYLLTLILFPLELVEFSLSPVCSKSLQSCNWEGFIFIHLETYRSAQGNFIGFFLKNFSSFHFLCPLFLALFLVRRWSSQSDSLILKFYICYFPFLICFSI